MARTRIRLDQADGEEFLSENEAEEVYVAKKDLPMDEGSLFIDGYVAFQNFFNPKSLEDLDPGQLIIYNDGGSLRVFGKERSFNLNTTAESGSVTPKLYSGNKEIYCSHASIHYEKLNRLVFITGSLSWELQDKKNRKPMYISGLPFLPLGGTLEVFSLEGSRGLKKKFCFFKDIDYQLMANDGSKILTLKKTIGDHIFALTTRDLGQTGTLRFKGFYLASETEGSHGKY